MTKEKMLEVLFTEWSNGHEDSPEYGVACATGEETDVVEGVVTESKLAFTAGFNAALALMRNTE